MSNKTIKTIVNKNNVPDEQEKVVNRAMEVLELEIGTVGWPQKKIEEYLNYVYSIGFFNGRKLIGHGKPILQIKDGIVIDSFQSATDAARKLRCSIRSIVDSTNGKQQYGGFEWRYF